MNEARQLDNQLNQNSSHTPVFGSESSKLASERVLDSDPVCRFNYAAKVIGLGEADFDVLHRNRELTERFLGGIVDRVYVKMFEFLPMKRHFTEQHHGFYGHVPATVEDVSLDDQQTEFRKHRLTAFLKKMSTAQHDETFVVLLDMIGKMHTPQKGNPTLAVPIMQVTALLGFIADQFFDEVSKLKLRVTERDALQRAYGKMFWVMNNMFLRHYQ